MRKEISPAFHPTQGKSRFVDFTPSITANAPPRNYRDNTVFMFGQRPDHYQVFPESLAGFYLTFKGKL